MKKRRTWWLTLFCICMISFFPAVQTHAQTASPNGLKILSLPPLVLDASTDSGSLLLHLQNQGTTPRSVILSAGNFINHSTRQEWGAGVTFSAPGGTERNIIHRKKLVAGAVETVAVHISKIWEAGESVAELLDQGKSIGQLKVLKINPPFNVTLLNQTQDKTVFSFERVKPLELILKNDDAMTYPLSLELRLGDQIYPFPGGTLPPHSSAALTIQLPSTAYKRTLAELFDKPTTLNGTLLFKLSPPTTLATGPWPVKTIPIEARLSAWSPQWRPVLSTAIIFLILLLGGICSLILSAWVPNQRRRLDLKEQLSQLAARIREISSQTDSALRVAVRMERHRLYKMLFSRWILTPDISILFNKCGQEIENLNKRIQILIQLDRTQEDLKAQSGSRAPQSLLDTVEEALKNASQILLKSEPREQDLKSAQDLVDGAGVILEKAEQPDPQFRERLLQRLSELKTQFEQGSDPISAKESCKRIRKELPEIFKVFTLQSQDQDFDFFNVDGNLLKLDLIKRFILAFENLSSGNASAWNNLEDAFLRALRLESRQALREARFLVLQIEEGITRESLEEEIMKPGSVFIKMDPEVVRANQPVKFTASLRSPSLNQASIRRLLICDWTFEHNKMTLTEKGWEVTHYFPTLGTFSLTLRFLNMEGRSLATCTVPAPPRNDEKPLSGEVLSDDSLKSWERFKVEMFYLSIVLGGTLLGLMAGAKDKLMELDVASGLIAVFLLGFGADTIKNLLTQRQSQP